MAEDHAGLLSAFDGAIAAVGRLESAGPFLVRLRADLEARRAELASGAAFDREWAGRLVRWVADWVPEQELPLIGRLGQIVRPGTGG